MSRRRDIRPRVIQNALGCPDLGNAERVFLVTVVMVATEYVDGQRRKGSHGMDERGNFALHYDYLARALHTSPGNAKKLAQRLELKGFLSKRFPGTFGRPAGYQALDVRGDNTYRITLRDFVPPYAVQDPLTRGDTASPLTYRTPDLGDPEPTSGVNSGAVVEAQAATRNTARHTAEPDVEVCKWCGPNRICPPDCAGHRADLRRSS